MLVVWPDNPCTEGQLRLPRPAVMLVGNICAPNPRCWQYRLAPRIEQHVGSVFYPAWQGVPSVAEFSLFSKWFIHWLMECDAILCWLDGRGPWPEFELGVAVGRGKRVVFGAAEPEQRLALEISCSAFGLPGPVHGNLEDAVTALEMVRR